MTLQVINLRKILKLMFCDDRALIKELRTDIRNEISRERGDGGGGGDFYGPFWKDAKDHVFEVSDLHSTTDGRIASNGGRANLYPQLRDGFLLWWDQRRRWTNAPFEPIATPKKRYSVQGVDTVVKVDCILAVRDGREQDHYVYPYWFPQPAIIDEAARIGLWLLIEAIPETNAEQLRVLDVIRGQTFSLDRNPLRGDEPERFRERFGRVAQLRERLRSEYE